MSKKKCSVNECSSNQLSMFRFPNPSKERERFLKWLSVAGNAALLTVPKDKITSRSICRRHFEDKYVLAKKLSKSAEPTLHLPEPIDVSQYDEANQETIDLPEGAQQDKNLLKCTPAELLEIPEATFPKFAEPAIEMGVAAGMSSDQGRINRERYQIDDAQTSEEEDEEMFYE